MYTSQIGRNSMQSQPFIQLAVSPSQVTPWANQLAQAHPSWSHSPAMKRNDPMNGTRMEKRSIFSQWKVGREVNCWTSMRCFVMKKNQFYWSAIHNKQKTFLLVVDWLCKATHAAAFSTWLIWIIQVWPKPISPGHHLIRVKETICHPLIFLA